MIIGYWVYAEDDENSVKDQSFTKLKDAYKYYTKLCKTFKLCILSLCQYTTVQDFVADQDLKSHEVLFRQVAI